MDKKSTDLKSDFNFQNPMRIGNLHIPNRVVLAPLAGVSDVPFRRVCQMHGAGLTYVEMLSSTAVRYRNKRTFETMARHSSESVLGVQVTGPSADDVTAAIEILSPMGFDTIDINMGCPVRKVVASGGGSAILKDLGRVQRTVEMARKSTSLPLTVKVRLGFTRDAVNVEESARIIAAAGADMLTIHGRTRSEGYSTRVDCDGIRAGIRSAAQTILDLQMTFIPILGNGDVFGTASAVRMRNETRCDGVMVSRGALGNPWVFREILIGKPYHPSFEEWYDTVSQHMAFQEEHYGSTPLAAILMRKHLLWYAKGFPGIKLLKNELNCVESLSDARIILKRYSQSLSPRTLRFESAGASLNDEQNSVDPKYEMHRELDRGVGDESLTPVADGDGI